MASKMSAVAVPAAAAATIATSTISATEATDYKAAVCYLNALYKGQKS